MKVATLHEESSDTFPFCKKATAQLNDVGVSLLHRGCMRQAIDTFKDALAVAQLSCRIKTSIMDNNRLASPTSFVHHDSVDVKKILEQAYDRLSHPKTSTPTDIELEVISDDENPAGLKSRHLVEEDTGSSINIQKENFVIQMDHLNGNLLSSEEEDMAIQCSIICYNYGVAYLCLSTLPKSCPFIDQLYMGALNMFHIAFSTLASHHLVKEELQAHHMNPVLITRFFVLHNLILISTKLGMMKEKAEYLQCLGHLKQSIDKFCDFHHIIPSPAAHAA